MVGILIITHGFFGQELLKTSEMIMGKQENAKAISLEYDKDIKELQKEVGEEIEKMNRGSGVIVLTDLFGGSTSNSVAMTLREHDFNAITGVNLPMLIECLSLREIMDIADLVEHIIQAGLEGIKNLKELVKGGNK